MREIIIYATSGKTDHRIQSAATTLGELKPEIKNAGFNYEGMKMVEGATQHTLESDEATLPQGDFILYMMPKATKSGNVREKVKGILTSTKGTSLEKKAYEHFNKEQSYTRTKNVELEKLLASWEKKNNKATPPTPISTTNSAKSSRPATRVSNTNSSTTNVKGNTSTPSNNNKEHLSSAISHLEAIVMEEGVEEVAEVTSILKGVLSDLGNPEIAQERKKERQKRAMEAQAERLKNTIPGIRNY